MATWSRPTSRLSFWLFWPQFVLRMRTISYFSASNQNFYIAIRFCDPDFLKHNNTLAIRRRCYAVTLTSDTWPQTSVVHRVSRDQTLYLIWAKLNITRLSYWRFSSASPFSRGRGGVKRYLRVRGATYIKLERKIGQAFALLMQFQILKSLLVFNYTSSKVKFRPNFEIFDSL